MLTNHIASTSATKPDVLAAKSINLFIRRHLFFAHQSLSHYTTSERRRFERDVYDYARAQGLPKAQAKAQRIKAREMCGEEEYDSDNSALGDEVDDSVDVLQSLAASVVKSTSSEVLPSIESKGAMVSTTARQEHVGSTYAKEDPPKAEQIEHETQTPNVQANATKVPEARTIVHKTVHGSKPEAQGSPVQHVEVAAGNSKVKAERRERKKAKRQAAATDNSKAKEPLAKNHNLSPDGAGPDNIVSSPKKGPNDPKSEAEAHENFLMSNEREPHEHGQNAEKSMNDLKEAEKRSTAFRADLRASRDFINDHAIDLYNQGKYKGASKEVRNDLKGMAAERKAMKEDKEKAAKAEGTSKKRKKRKSVATDEIEEETVSHKKKHRPYRHGKPEDLSSPKTSGFHSPMIQ